MRVSLLKNNPLVYSCNVYLVRGDWNKIEDINTLIDVGTDGFIIEELKATSTGFGKKRVEQVIITHEHFDHAGGLVHIKKEYNPTVFSHAHLKFTDFITMDGLELQIGDKQAVIFNTPGHSNDSICIYCEEESTLFSGDTPVNIRTPGGSYNAKYVEALEKLVKLKVNTLYPGHDYPVLKDAHILLQNTLKNVLKSDIVG